VPWRYKGYISYGGGGEHKAFLATYRLARGVVYLNNRRFRLSGNYRYHFHCVMYPLAEGAGDESFASSITSDLPLAQLLYRYFNTTLSHAIFHRSST
jgi:hypothetical protein